MQRSTTTLLSATEEAKLARRVRGADIDDSLAARNELVLSNLGLVGKAASYCVRKHQADYDELFAEGMLGLIDAAQHFNPDRGKRFSTYAMVVVHHQMRRYALRERKTVRAVILPMEPAPSPLDAILRQESAEAVYRALGELAPLRAYILAHRHGLCGMDQKTLGDLADELGFTREWVRQLEVKARDDLTAALARRQSRCA